MKKTDLQLIEDTLNPTNYLTTGRVSFNILVERHASSVYFFIYKLVGNKEDSEDIIQETFIKAWQKLAKFDTDLSFKTWLFSIARNTAIDKLRKKKTIAFSSLNILDSIDNMESGGKDFESGLKDEEPLPDEIFEKNESEEKLKNALTELSETERLLIYLHITEELTFEEIAKITDRPMNTIKSQYRRAISKLRELLK